jgi:hypothetical protein
MKVALVALIVAIATGSPYIVAAAAPVNWSGLRLPLVAADLTNATDAMVYARPSVAGTYDWRVSQTNLTLEDAAWREVVRVRYGATAGGWHVEHFHANRTMMTTSNDEIERAYFGVGYADGYINAQRIWNSYIATTANDYETIMVNPTTDAAVWVKNFTQTQFQWLQDMETNAGEGIDLTAARSVRRQLAMYRGRQQGYSERFHGGALTSGAGELDQWQIWFMSSRVDLETLKNFAPFKSNGGLWVDYHPWWPNPSPYWSEGDVAEELSAYQSRGLCAAKLFPTDLFVGRSTSASYADMNNSLTIITLESQITFVRQLSSMSSSEDVYLTSNKLFICSTGNTVVDSRLLNNASPRVLTTAFQSFFAAMLAVSTTTFAAVFAGINPIVPQTWLAVDFQQIVVTAGSLALQENAATVVDTYPGSVSFVSDVTVNLTTGTQLVVVANQPSVRTRLKPACDSCGLMATAEGPALREFPRIVANVSTVDDFLHAMRFNNFTSDPDSVLGTPFNPLRCAGRAIGARNDLNNMTMANNSWGPQLHCRRSDSGSMDASATSYEMWLQGIAADGATPSYPMVALVSPPYGSAATPPYRPSVPFPGQLEQYLLPPVVFANDVPRSFRLVPNDATPPSILPPIVTESESTSVPALITMSALVALGVGLVLMLYVTRPRVYASPPGYAYSVPQSAATAGGKPPGVMSGVEAVKASSERTRLL